MNPARATVAVSGLAAPVHSVRTARTMSDRPDTTSNRYSIRSSAAFCAASVKPVADPKTERGRGQAPHQANSESRLQQDSRDREHDKSDHQAEPHHHAHGRAQGVLVFDAACEVDEIRRAAHAEQRTAGAAQRPGKGRPGLRNRGRPEAAEELVETVAADEGAQCEQRRRPRQVVPDYVDWKDVEFLRQFIPERGKIMPRCISGKQTRRTGPGSRVPRRNCRCHSPSSARYR